MPEIRPHINPQTGKFDVHIKNTTIGAQETLKGTVNQLVDQDMRNTGRFNFLKRGWLRLSQPFRKIGYEKTVKKVIERTGSYYVSSDAVREAAEQAQTEITERRQQLREESLKDKLNPRHFLERGKLALRRKTVAREYTARAAEALQRQAGTQGAADRERFLVHEATQVARMQAEGASAQELGELPQGLEELSPRAKKALVEDVIAPLVTGQKSRLIKSNLSEANIYRALRKFTQRDDLPDDKEKLARMFGEKSTVIKMRAENFASDVIAVAKAIQEDARTRGGLDNAAIARLSSDVIARHVGAILVAKDDIAKDALANFSAYDQLVAQINNRVPLGAVAVVAAATAIAGQYAIRSGLRHIPFVGSALVGGLMGGAGKHAEISRTVKEYRLAKGENPSNVPVPSPDKKLKKLQEFDYARRSVHDLLTNPTEQRNPTNGEITKRKGLTVLAQEYQVALGGTDLGTINRAEEALLGGIGEIQARLNLFDERRTHLDFDGASPVALIQGLLAAKKAILGRYGGQRILTPDFDDVMDKIDARTQTEMQRFRQQMGTTNAEFNRYRAIEVAKAAAVGAVAGAVVGFISQELALEGGDLLAWAVEHAKPVIEEGIHLAQQGLDAAGNFIHNIPSVGGALDAAGNALHHTPGVGDVINTIGNVAHGARSKLEFFLSREGRGPQDIYKNGGAFTVELQGHGDEISIGQDHSVWLLDGSGVPHLVGAIDANHVLHTTTDINHLPPGLAHEFSQHGIKVEHADSLQQFITSGEPPPPGSGLPSAPEGTYWGVQPDGKWDLVDAYNPQHILLREVFVDSKGFHFDPNHVDPSLGMPEGVRGITSESSSILSPFLHPGPESQSWITAHQLEFYDKPSFDGGWHAIQIQAPPNSNFLQVVIPGKGATYILLPRNHQLLFDPNDHNANYTFQVIDKSGHLTTIRGDELSRIYIDQNEAAAMHQAGAGGTELSPQFRSVFTIANDGQRGTMSSVLLTEKNGVWDTTHVAHTATVFGTGKLPGAITTGAEASRVPAYLYYNPERVVLTPAEELQEGLIIAGAGATLATFMTALLLKARGKEGQHIAFNASLTSFVVTSALLAPAMPWLGVAGIAAGTALLVRNMIVQGRKAKAAKGGKKAKAKKVKPTPAAAPVQPPQPSSPPPPPGSQNPPPPPPNTPPSPGAPRPLVAPFVAAALTDTERRLPAAQRADAILSDFDVMDNASNRGDSAAYQRAYNRLMAHGFDDRLPSELGQDQNLQIARDQFIATVGEALALSSHPELDQLLTQREDARGRDPQEFARLSEAYRQQVMAIYNREVIPQFPTDRDAAIQRAEASFMTILEDLADRQASPAQPTGPQTVPNAPPARPPLPPRTTAQTESARNDLRSELSINENDIDVLNRGPNPFGRDIVEIRDLLGALSPQERAALARKLAGIDKRNSVARAAAVRGAYQDHLDGIAATGPQPTVNPLNGGPATGSFPTPPTQTAVPAPSPRRGPAFSVNTDRYQAINTLLPTGARFADRTTMNAALDALPEAAREAILAETDSARKNALIARYLNPAAAPTPPVAPITVNTGEFNAIRSDLPATLGVRNKDDVNALLAGLSDIDRRDIELETEPTAKRRLIVDKLRAIHNNPTIPSMPVAPTRVVDTGMHAALSDDFRRRFPTPESVNAALSQLPDDERQDIERQIRASTTAQEGEGILERALASTTNPVAAIDAKAGLEALGFDDMLLSEIKRPSQHFVESDTDLLARIQAMTPAARARMLGEMRTLPHPLDQANLVMRAVGEDEYQRSLPQPPVPPPILPRPSVETVFGEPGSAEEDDFHETTPHMAVRQGDFQRFVRDTMTGTASREELQRQFERFNSALRFAYRNPDEAAWEDFKRRYGFFDMTREEMRGVSPETAFAHLLAEAHNNELLNPPGVTLADIPQREAEIDRQEQLAATSERRLELNAERRDLAAAQNPMVDTFLTQQFGGPLAGGYEISLRNALLNDDAGRINQLRGELAAQGVGQIPSTETLLREFADFRQNARFTVTGLSSGGRLEEVRPGEALTDEERQNEIEAVLRALEPIQPPVADMPTEQHPIAPPVVERTSFTAAAPPPPRPEPILPDDETRPVPVALPPIERIRRDAPDLMNLVIRPFNTARGRNREEVEEDIGALRDTLTDQGDFAHEISVLFPPNVNEPVPEVQQHSFDAMRSVVDAVERSNLKQRGILTDGLLLRFVDRMRDAVEDQNILRLDYNVYSLIPMLVLAPVPELFERYFSERYGTRPQTPDDREEMEQLRVEILQTAREVAQRKRSSQALYDQMHAVDENLSSGEE